METTGEPSGALVERARNGERAALAELYESQRERLLWRIRLMLGEGARGRAESSDFLQGLFVALLEDVDNARFTDIDGFVRWATQVARNDIRDEARRRRGRALESLSRSLSALAPPDASREAPDAQAQRGDELDQLLAALEALRPEDRELIELRDLEGLTFREIAARTDRPSEGAAQVAHARALARLSRELT